MVGAAVASSDEGTCLWRCCRDCGLWDRALRRRDVARPDQAARVYLACLDGNDDDRLRRAARRERRHRRSRRGCFGACWRGDQRLCVLAGGERSYTGLDWLCLAGAAIALVAWGFACGPLTAVIRVALVDAIGAVPTIRKAIAKPDDEGSSPFLLANFKRLLAIYALDHMNLLRL